MAIPVPKIPGVVDPIAKIKPGQPDLIGAVDPTTTGGSLPTGGFMGGQPGYPGGTAATTTVSPPATTPTTTTPPVSTPPPAPKTPDATSGIVGSNMASYDPTLNTVGTNETVSGNVDKLLQADNPLMQTARNQSAEAANAKGLLNSSMAVQAGQQAVINSALPIASADASTYHDTAARNQVASNEADQFNTGAKNQSGLLAQQGAQTSQLSAQQAGQEREIQALRGDQAAHVADIEAQYKTLMQTNASAASLFNEYQKNIASILDDPNTTAAQKQAAVEKMSQVLQASLTIMGGVSNLDLTSLLDFSNLSGTPPQGSPGAPPSAPPVPGEPGYVPPTPTPHLPPGYDGGG